ncbi:MAG: aminotransferase class I/II-fold pyridoxal phosphate-dependent enzyme [Oscillospiraceae bacterium]
MERLQSLRVQRGTCYRTAIAAFTEPGDRVILQRPVYGPFTDAVTQQGREISNNALLLQNGHYEVDFEDLERRAADPRANS